MLTVERPSENKVGRILTFLSFLYGGQLSLCFVYSIIGKSFLNIVMLAKGQMVFWWVGIHNSSLTNLVNVRIKKSLRSTILHLQRRKL